MSSGTQPPPTTETGPPAPSAPPPPFVRRVWNALSNYSANFTAIASVGVIVVAALWVQAGIKDGQVEAAKTLAERADARAEAATRDAEAAKTALLVLQQGDPDDFAVQQAKAIVDLDLSTPSHERDGDAILLDASEFPRQPALTIRVVNKSLLTLRDLSFVLLTESDWRTSDCKWNGPSADPTLPRMCLAFASQYDPGSLTLAPGQPAQFSMTFEAGKTKNEKGVPVSRERRAGRIRVIAYASGFLQKEFDLKLVAPEFKAPKPE